MDEFNFNMDKRDEYIKAAALAAAKDSAEQAAKAAAVDTST
jgi:hypothetical protein